MLSIFSKRDDIISSLEYEIGRLEGLQKAHNICVDRINALSYVPKYKSFDCKHCGAVNQIGRCSYCGSSGE